MWSCEQGKAEGGAISTPKRAKLGTLGWSSGLMVFPFRNVEAPRMHHVTEYYNYRGAEYSGGTAKSALVRRPTTNHQHKMIRIR